MNERFDLAVAGFAAAGAGLIYGLVILLIFGPIIIGSDWKVHLLITTASPFCFWVLFYNSILVRQLALPALIAGVIYQFATASISNKYLFFGLFVLSGLTLGVYSLTEALIATGKISDFGARFCSIR